MKNGKINHSLIDEYGLNEVTYKLLKLAEGSPITWGGPGLKAITGQPANSLRKLVDRGLLTGPARDEKISARPFALTAAGRDTLARIERGLHRNVWMSAGKLKVLELLEGGGALSQRELMDAGANTMSMLSVIDAGYISQRRARDWYYYGITEVGREALTQWRSENTARATPVQKAVDNEKAA